MIDNDSIDLSIENIWRAYDSFQKGKKRTVELENFHYNLETNLFALQIDLQGGDYKHGQYRHFETVDNKKRKISVAIIRDRVVHRLLYEKFVEIFDRTFIYDVWSCRAGKGLLGAIERTQKFAQSNKSNFAWRADVKKFFDNIDHNTLKAILAFKIKDDNFARILEEVINSYSLDNIIDKEGGGKCCGIPIGNLTSQIFANIYLNEFDRYVKHSLRIKYYLRYGDDFVIFGKNREELEKIRILCINFLKNWLKLDIKRENDIIIPVRRGLKFLGVEIWPGGRRLKKRNWLRIKNRLGFNNISSYFGLVHKHADVKKIKYLVHLGKTTVEFNQES